MTKKDCSQLNWANVDSGFMADNWDWILPQVASLIGGLPLVTQNGVVSPSQTAIRLRERAHHWPNGTPVQGLGSLWKMLQTTPRGTVMKGTQNAAGSRWNSGVPLILSCWRQHRGVRYSSWDFSDDHISQFVDRDVLALVRDLGSLRLDDDLAEIREQARVVKTGVRSGSLRSLTSPIPFGGLGSDAFQGLSRLSKYCVTQTWIYHPSVRHPLQICAADLDNHPPPLVVDNVLTPLVQDTKKNTQQPDNPFDL